ncbi:MAG: tetratricopeptide repeat protein, partial [Anaerolineae bacterium]
MNWKPRLPADPRTAWLKWLALLCAAGLALALRAPRLLAQDDSPTGIMLQANRLYEAGQFAEAAQTYRQLIDRGLQNQVVYYNLGNAYFKQGDLGRAILNYRRAGRLVPRAPDIRANLTLARAQTVDAIQVAGKAPLNELATLVQTWLTLNEMAALSLGLWLALALLVIARSHL